MAQPFESLRRADQPAGAADIDLAFLGNRFAPAFGTMVRECISVARLASAEVFDHLRDDVASALDADPVADAEAEPGDLVAIMERDVLDDDPADADRGQPADRSELTSAADLDVDRFESRLGFLSRE